jgi:hypothetical protein
MDLKLVVCKSEGTTIEGMFDDTKEVTRNHKSKKEIIQ